MPTKQLTIDIPEPIEGRCSSDCPMRQADEFRDFCAAGADMGSFQLAPGPKCPQYQGEPSPTDPPDNKQKERISHYLKQGFDKVHIFRGEYVLLMNRESLQKVRVYEDGSVIETDPRSGEYREVTP